MCSGCWGRAQLRTLRTGQFDDVSGIPVCGEAAESVQDKRGESRIALSCPSRVLVGFDGGAIVESRRDVAEGTPEVRVIEGVGT